MCSMDLAEYNYAFQTSVAVEQAGHKQAARPQTLQTHPIARRSKWSYMNDWDSEFPTLIKLNSKY